MPKGPRLQGSSSPGETRILLVRHGEVYNPHRVFYGRLPRFGLTARGRAQVLTLARALADRPVAAVYTSPLLRARQTAAILCGGLGAVPLHRSRLITEVGSPFDGRPAAELAARRWDLYSGSPRGFEQPADVLVRARRFLDLVRWRHGGARVIAVTHGDLIALAILWALAAPLTPEAIAELGRGGFPLPYPRAGSLTELCFATREPEELPGVRHQPVP